MKALRKQLWNLQRFGLTPRGLWQRLVPPEVPPVLLVSLPKSGTHLVERALCLWPQLYRVVKPTIRRRNVDRYGGLPHLLDRLRPGQVLVAHAAYSREIEEAATRNGVRAVFCCRDLRAVLASWAHHVVSLKSHYLHEVFAGIEDPKERIRMILEGDGDGRFRSMVATFQGNSGWMTSSCHVVRFEELVGGRGGGSAEAQAKALDELWDFLDLPRDRATRDRIRRRVFSEASPTFRAGGKIPWQQTFDGDLTRLFESRTGNLLERYGYGDPGETSQGNY